ncbi:MAG: DUF1934 domain-containing protein [Clostridia bacterium]|nr:DUF1934 domain-containing protein [Clostridia bacterium]
MHIHLSTLTFDADGQGEKSEYTYHGHYEERGDVCRLLWQREEEGVVTKTTLSFHLQAKETVCMRQSGGCEYEMVFAVGKEHEGIYRIPGAGDFDLRVKTERLENTLSAVGGRLRLDYEMLVGGMRQRIILTLVAETKG